MQIVLVSALFTVLGGLIGAFVVHLLTRSRDREHWIRDRRMLEWSELLAILAKTHVLRLNWMSHAARTQSDEDSVALAQAEADSFATLSDRIFVADEVEDLELQNLWNVSRKRFLDGDREGYISKFVELRRIVIRTATRSNQSSSQL